MKNLTLFVEWIDFSFDKAVEILYWTVNFTGVSYEAVNVLIFGLFAIAWPLTTIHHPKFEVKSSRFKPDIMSNSTMSHLVCAVLKLGVGEFCHENFGESSLL